MANNQALLEDDEDEDDETGSGAPANGAAQSSRPAADTRQQSTLQTGDEGELEIIETDDQGKPLGTGHDDDGRGQESNLSEDQQGSDAYLDQQGQGANEPRSRAKWRNRRRGQERALVENAQLKARLAALEGETAQLRQFAGRVEPKLAEFSEQQLQNKIGQVDGQLSRAETDLETAERGIAEAIRSNDETALIAALRTRDEKFIAKSRLSNEKDALATAVAAAKRDGGDRGTSRTGAASGEDDHRANPQQERQQQPLSRTAAGLAKDFQTKHSWVDPNSSDPDIRRDSKRVLFLDNEVTTEGFRPDDADYWNELEDRMRDVLPPERFETRPRQRANANGNGAAKPNANGGQVPAARRGPMTSGPSERSSGAPNKRQVYISPARKTAMQQAGILDADGKPTDAEKFKRVVAGYHEFDRLNGQAQQ